MLNKLLMMLRRYEMVQPGDTVICAVSGGADSVALLLGMYLLKDKLGIQLQAAHYNHCLRGEESDADARFVQALCDRYEIPLHMGVGKVTAGKKGLEAAAREARYAFFDTLPGKIATAHTANDNAETVLMHMVRGTGLKGLGAIAPVRNQLIRPMLQVTRQQVLAFLQEYHMDHVEDSSNKTDRFLRNRLRHGVMPLLLEENPRLMENLSEMALGLREDEEALSFADVPEVLSVQALREMPKARRSRLIGAFLQRCGVREPERTHIALTEALVFSDNPSATAALPGGIKVCRCYDRLQQVQDQKEIAVTVLQIPGVTELPESGWRVICTPAESLVNTEDTFTVVPVGTVVLRSRCAGDSIRLPGGSKLLKKLLIDKKIPASDRKNVPVVSDEGGVLGVYGVGVNLDRMASGLPAMQIRLETCRV